MEKMFLFMSCQKIPYNNLLTGNSPLWRVWLCIPDGLFAGTRELLFGPDQSSLFSRLNEPSSLSLFSQGKCSRIWPTQWSCTKLASVYQCLSCIRGPKLDVALMTWSQTTGQTSASTTEDAVGHPACQGSLLPHAKLAAYQVEHQGFFSRAFLSQGFSFPGAWLGIYCCWIS